MMASSLFDVAAANTSGRINRKKEEKMEQKRKAEEEQAV